MKRRRWAWIALGAVPIVVACGASVSAVYEGDVRFERCMALDWQRDVDPQIRRGCWEEWERFYTLGQTRDRIEYARAQIGKLGPTPDASASASAEAPLLAIPEPTSVFVPPPAMLAGPDAGEEASDAGTDAGDAGPPKNECRAACDDRVTECLKVCKGPVCAKGCAAARQKCVERCK